MIPNNPLTESERAELEIERLRDKIAQMLKALKKIEEGRGHFSMDLYEHACNTIEDMMEIARDAIAAEGEA